MYSSIIALSVSKKFSISITAALFYDNRWIVIIVDCPKNYYENPSVDRFNFSRQSHRFLLSFTLWNQRKLNFDLFRVFSPNIIIFRIVSTTLYIYHCGGGFITLNNWENFITFGNSFRIDPEKKSVFKHVLGKSDEVHLSKVHNLLHC